MMIANGNKNENNGFLYISYEKKTHYDYHQEQEMQD